LSCVISKKQTETLPTKEFSHRRSRGCSGCTRTPQGQWKN